MGSSSIGPAPQGTRGRALVFALLTSVSSAIFSAAHAADSLAEGLENGLVPAVVIRGAGPNRTALVDRMKALRVPGISIAVIRNGTIAWAGGLGAADSNGTPVTSDTLFQAASISKPVAALLALKIAQDGKLDIDADVNRYLRTWKVPESSLTSTSKVTLRRLLTHTAGMTVHGFPGYVSTGPLPTVPQILDGRPPANTEPIVVDTLPGLKWRYSGGGYVVAQQVIADFTGGGSFAELANEKIFVPLGMKHSTFVQPLPQELAVHAAAPHDATGNALNGGARVFPELAAAGLWTTPSDLARYAIGVQAALAGRPSAVVSQDTARAMLTVGLNDQGIGVRVGGSTARKYFEHGGSNPGFRCELVAYQDGEGVVVMTNGDGGALLATEIVRTIAHDHQWPDFAPPERTLARLDSARADLQTGVYGFRNGMRLSFWRSGDKVFARMRGQAAVELLPLSAVEYMAKSVDATLRFPVGGDGSPLQVTLVQNAVEQPATRVLDAEATTFFEESRRATDLGK